MRLVVKGDNRQDVRNSSRLEGSVTAPPSKSHTHRAILVASLARGESVVQRPLLCDDTLATLEACKAFGAVIEGSNEIAITGVDGRPKRSDAPVDVGESGTTMRFMAAAFALADGGTTITCGQSLASRPMGPLLNSLADLGATRAMAFGPDGRPPVCIAGRMAGGSATLDASSSQFLSALLLACPLAEKDSMISVTGLRSEPYAAMTLEHLERAGARVWGREMSEFFIPGSQSYRPGDYRVPGDWSAAAFLHAAGLVTGSDISIEGLMPDDAQGDKSFPELAARIMSGDGADTDLRNMPDLLPALAVVACFSQGETVLGNAAHARDKESDRIAAMASELRKMGADVVETPDGLRIKGTGLRGAEVDSHGDHRVAMALAVAGLAAHGMTIINGADTISKSYPGFVADLAGLGADIRAVDA